MKFVSKPIIDTRGITVQERMSTPEHPPLKFFKTTTAAFDPQWGTAHAACFDIRACLEYKKEPYTESPSEDTVTAAVEFLNAGSENKISGYGLDNEKFKVEIRRKMDDERPYVIIEPGMRLMIPTGLIFDIPVGYSVRIHIRSGIALKQGLVLVNHEGVIDADYVDPTFILLTNISEQDAYIFHGDRIAQGELIPDLAYNVEETYTQPAQKTDRVGGFGSTGTN